MALNKLVVIKNHPKKYKYSLKILDLLYLALFDQYHLKPIRIIKINELIKRIFEFVAHLNL